MLKLTFSVIFKTRVFFTLVGAELVLVVALTVFEVIFDVTAGTN